jgi:hypothetical protein
VIGAAGFGHEVLDIVDVAKVKSMSGLRPICALDNHSSQDDPTSLRRRGVPSYGTVAERLHRGDDASFVMGIGHPAVRQLAERCQRHGGCLSRRSAWSAPAVVLEQRGVGAGAVVGTAACVTRDVEPGMTAMGVPAQ